MHMMTLVSRLRTPPPHLGGGEEGEGGEGEGDLGYYPPNYFLRPRSDRQLFARYRLRRQHTPGQVTHTVRLNP